MSKTGNTAFTFPVGDQNNADLRTLAIAAPATATDQLSIAYWKGDVASGLDPTGGAHSRAALNTAGIPGVTQLASVSPIGFWDFIPVAGTDQLTVTISIPDFSGPGGYTLPATMRVVGWNTTTNVWDNISGATGPTSNAEGTTMTGTVTNMANYSAIAVGNVLVAPLPVKLIAFTAQPRNCNAQLQWTTAVEQGLSYLDVQGSDDAANFISLARIKPSGDVTGGKYEYTAAQTAKASAITACR